MSEKKKKNKFINILLAITFGALGTFFVIVAVTTVYQRINLKKQAEQVRIELKRLEEEKEDLTATKAKLEDDNYVVTYARGEYMFSKGNEKLFKLPSKK